MDNDLIESGKIEVTLKTRIGTWTRKETKTVDVTRKGLAELTFRVQIDRQVGELSEPRTDRSAGRSPDVQAVFELTVAAGEARHLLRQTVPIRPYGMPIFHSTSGTASSDTTAWISLPEGMPVDRPSMQITIGPNIQRSLLDIVLAPAPWCQVESSRLVTTIDVTSSDLMASLALANLLDATQQSSGPEAQSLDARIRAAVGSLISTQRDDGTWGWCIGKKVPPNRYVTARNVWALQLARRAGYRVSADAMEKGIVFLKSDFAKLDPSDHESRAVVLHALAVAGQADFSQANRLYRARQGLSSTGLCYLALTFAETDRQETARELLGLVGQRDLSGSSRGALTWNTSRIELRAIYTLALQAASSKAPEVKLQVEWLLAHRTGHRWSPDKATGPATMAVAHHFAKRQFKSAAYKLAILINNTRAAELDITPSTQTHVLDVPAELLTFAGGKSKQAIRFQLTGRGEYTYQVSFGGFVPAEKLKGTTQEWSVQRHYRPAQLELDGEAVPRGFGVVDGTYQSFRNRLTQLPVGKRGQVELHVWQQNVGSRTPDTALPYLVIHEPIPSGATVVPNSIHGGVERYEIGSDSITFYVGARRGIHAIRYDLRGYLPGVYRVAPTVVRDAYAPGRLAVAPARSLTVLPLGSKTKDAYRLSPDELFQLGKKHFEKGRFEEVVEHLSKLLADWRLRADPYKESVEMLLEAHLHLGPSHKVVEYFEIVKEKWPELEIAFDKILKIGAAYHAMGEYERSYLVFRATVESSFLREVRVAGFLDAEGEFLESVRVMSRILRGYPPEPYVASARYALAQQVYAKGDAISGDAALRATFREKKITRIDLVRQALRMLEAFLTNYPEDPAADEAAFSVANALLELKEYQAAIDASNTYAERYPDSPFVESYWYTVGFCHFALGQHDAALTVCTKVAEMKRHDKKSGRMIEAENRWQAVYILGQIYHSLGQAAEAIRYYARVKDRFPDAAQAIEYFTRKEIRLPEVTALGPGEAKPVELAFRNIAACDVRVYKIDLMKFSLLKRNLKNITQINLAGIRPYYEGTIELGDGKDYRNRKHPLSMPLEAEGAYLVVCRGDDLYASGLVLVSPLVLDVQEDAATGRVRATVKEMLGADDDAKNLAEDLPIGSRVAENQRTEPGIVTAFKYVADVHVKVIGSKNAA
ncbi:MAG: tetratricopeptide repeat protein, partial [Pirellulales bacterium]